jgi:phospholipid/cholesterol/gamma-HCH transport system permease protein
MDLSRVENIFREIGRGWLLFKEALLRVRKKPFYRDEFFVQMDYIGVSSLPIIILTGLFTGMVIAIDTAYSLEMFGVKAYIGKGVAIAQVRELGPVIGALMVNGRVGAGIAAEIASMVITEQVEAMRALGVDPVKKLVLPRILAGMVSMPLLTIITDIAGIIGGGIIVVFFLKLSAAFYFSSALNILDYQDIIIGLTKPFFFGLIMTACACYMGMSAYGGPQGVGRATTRAVVVSSILILFADFLLAKFFFWLF